MSVSLNNLYSDGVNFNGLIQSLVSLQEAPVNQLEETVSNEQQTESSWQTLNTQLATLQSASQSLTQLTTYQQTQASSSDSGVVSASSDGSATSGSYAVKVSQLAQSEIDLSAAQSSPTTALGYSGSFTINGASINVSASDNLNTLATAINAAKSSGVTAQVVQDQLVIQANTSDAPIKYTDPNGILSGLGILTSTGTNNAYQSAQPLEYTLDGASVTQPTNTDSSTLQGVTLSFSQTGTSTVSVGTNTSAISNAIQAWVGDYNTVMGTLNTDLATGGQLASSVTAMELQSNLSNVADSIVSSGAQYQSLPDIGITLPTSVNGGNTLQVDTSQLTTAIQNNLSDVQNIFSSATGVATQMQSLMTSYTETNGIIPTEISGIGNMITSQDQQITLDNQNIAAYQKQLQSEFLATQEAIAKLDGQSTSTSSATSASGLGTSVTSTSSSTSGSGTLTV